MPSLVLTGHPCAGKTAFARLLAARALRHPSRGAVSRVVHIRESAACPDQTKAACYADARAEQTTRAALKAEFDRAVASSRGGDDDDALVLLDSLNYIKGYRYELYCISKAAGTRHGTVWITAGDGGEDRAKRRNRERKESQTQRRSGDRAAGQGNGSDAEGYYEDDETMDGLVLRFEPPDDKNRWENPLYKVDLSSCLPWTKDGTIGAASSDSPLPGTAPNQKESADPSPSREEERSESAASLTRANHPPREPAQSTKKSGAGFKRRSKKPAQRGSTARRPEIATATLAAAPTNAPSSIASRNLAPGAGAPTTDRGDGGPSRLEDVVDDLLDSFFTRVAPLREGMSTQKRDAAAADALHRADRAARGADRRLVRAQATTAPPAAAGRRRLEVALADGDGARRRVLTLARPLDAAALGAMRRQFLSWIAGHPMADGATEEDVAAAYLSYVESHL